MPNKCAGDYFSEIRNEYYLHSHKTKYTGHLDEQEPIKELYPDPMEIDTEEEEELICCGVCEEPLDACTCCEDEPMQLNLEDDSDEEDEEENEPECGYCDLEECGYCLLDEIESGFF